MRRVSSILRIALVWLGIVAGAATPRAEAATAADGDVAALPAALIETLSRAGLTGRGEPVAAFTWTLETRRPARGPRQIRERYAGTPTGAPLGLSPVVHETLSPKPRPPRAGVSVRGLTIVRPDDDGIDVRVDGLSLPLEQGARFRLEFDQEGSTLSQTCIVAASRPAAGVHPALPGDARAIECSGRGSYHGVPVQVVATMLYFVRLGVFLEVEQRIDSPLGRLRGSARVLSFEMAKR